MNTEVNCEIPLKICRVWIEIFKSVKKIYVSHYIWLVLSNLELYFNVVIEMSYTVPKYD